jgi:hypothetical protein
MWITWTAKPVRVHLHEIPGSVHKHFRIFGPIQSTHKPHHHFLHALLHALLLIVHLHLLHALRLSPVFAPLAPGPTHGKTPAVKVSTVDAGLD